MLNVTFKYASPSVPKVKSWTQQDFLQELFTATQCNDNLFLGTNMQSVLKLLFNIVMSTAFFDTKNTEEMVP